MNNISRSIIRIVLYLLLVILIIGTIMVFAIRITNEKRETAVNIAKQESENIRIINIDVSSGFANRLNEENLIIVGDTECPSKDDIEKIMNCGGLMGYYISEYFIADINSDGEYEIYTNSHAGSGIVHDYIECYDSKSGTYSKLEDRLKKNYKLVIYSEELYIVALDHMMSSQYSPRVYKATIENGKISYNSIPIKMENIIMKEALGTDKNHRFLFCL